MSSSDEEDDSPAEESNVVIPETDGDELSESETDDEDLVPVIPSRRSMAARLAVSDESSDDEEKLRKSFYEAESSAEENEPSIEEKAFSKSTRRSIDPRESTVPDSGSDDDSVVIEETEDEAEPEEDAKPMNPIFSSTIRSPLREISDNIQPISIDDSYEEESSSVGNGAGNDTSAKIKVSRSMYEKIKTEKETLENQKNAFEGRKNLFRSLPDGGHKMMVQIEKLVSDIKKKEEELNSMIIDDNLSVKNEITRSFNSSNNSSVSFHDITPKPVPKPIEEVIILDDIRPTFFGKVGMENFMQMKRSVEEKLTDLLKDINDRPEDTEEVEEPNYLKVELMKHQRQALRFMIWREGCRPRGGILADGKELARVFLGTLF